MDMMISRTVDLLIRHDSRLEEKRKIYEYGMNLIFSALATTLGTILIYSGLGYFSEVVLMMLFFAFLRTYAGGFHAKTRLSCFIIFTTIAGCVIFLSQQVSLEAYKPQLVAGLVCAVIFIMFLAPLDTKNKLLKEKQKYDYRKKSIGIVLSQSLIIFGLYKLSLDKLALVGIFSIYAVVFTMVLRVFQKRLRGE